MNWGAEAWANALAQRLRRPLHPDEAASVATLPIRARSIAAGDYFCRETDTSGRCCLLCDGMLIESKLTQNGTRQIVGVRLTGEFAGLQTIALDACDNDVLASVPSAFLEAEAAPVRALGNRHPAIGKTLFAEALVAGSIAKEWVTNVGRRSAAARLAHLICELALRSDGGSLTAGRTLKLLLTQEQIGDSLGLGRAAVNRSLGELVALGLLAQRGNVITIIDPDKLQRSGDFSARYLHLGQSPHDRRRSAR